MRTAALQTKQIELRGAFILHDHPHGHEQKHDMHDGGENAVRQTIALLKYMLEHNRHHAEELHDLAHQLNGQGKEAAADRIHEAIHSFNEGNDLLEQALAAIESEQKEN